MPFQLVLDHESHFTKRTRVRPRLPTVPVNMLKIILLHLETGAALFAGELSIEMSVPMLVQMLLGTLLTAADVTNKPLGVRIVYPLVRVKLARVLELFAAMLAGVGSDVGFQLGVRSKNLITEMAFVLFVRV